MQLVRYLVVPLMTTALAGTGISVAAQASADCVTTNGTTLCSQGDVRGSDSGGGVSVPYPCEDDWYCDDDGWGLGIILDPGHDTRPPAVSPPRPDNDLPRPDRPNRPNRPGRGR